VVEKVIIMGAAGRDFHNFNIYFRGNPRYRVICFTATQIPDIDGRIYPPELAGDGYPEGIPVHPDSELDRLIRETGTDLVVFSYSDITHEEVMHKASLVTAAGADFMIAGATYTMLPATKPVVAVCAVRTGCGKSQVSREIARVLKNAGRRVVIIRHPMPYGDLRAQAVQRFARYEDLERHRCTIEEREEFEPILDMGVVVYAGVDYGRILTEAEAEADVIVWDGGNNDTPFYRPTVHVTVFDPHRAGHELRYHPGETNLRMCDVAVINKVDTATQQQVEAVQASIRMCNPGARVVLAGSPLTVDNPELIRGKRVLVVEDEVPLARWSPATSPVTASGSPWSATAPRGRGGTHRRPRRRRARPGPARARRAGGLPGAACVLRLLRAHADRAQRVGRQAAGAGRRRRRLPHQAVQPS